MCYTVIILHIQVQLSLDRFDHKAPAVVRLPAQIQCQRYRYFLAFLRVWCNHVSLGENLIKSARKMSLFKHSHWLAQYSIARMNGCSPLLNMQLFSYGTYYYVQLILIHFAQILLWPGRMRPSYQWNSMKLNSISNLKRGMSMTEVETNKGECKETNRQSMSLQYSVCAVCFVSSHGKLTILTLLSIRFRPKAIEAVCAAASFSKRVNWALELLTCWCSVFGLV